MLSKLKGQRLSTSWRTAASSTWRNILHYMKGSISGSRKFSSGVYSVQPEVADAIESGKAVVALETTIVTHGMPHPQNIETALEVEEVVRNQGAVPASVGLLDGVVHVGLSAEQLERLAVSSPVHKVSRRDLAYCLSEGYSGGTTVAGTMVCARKAGIPVFVTGGIGGVHREGEKTLDISADLIELGRTAVAVVCAGIKSILDIGRTLEYLETQGVPVVTIGQELSFPSFFTANSGYKAPHHVTSPSQAARIIDASFEFGMTSGLLFGVPVPSSTSSMGDMIEEAIQRALKEAKDRGISGKDVTPFVLQRINELTGGQSLKINIELVKNNACVGSRIAVELAQIRKRQRVRRRSEKQSRKSSSKKKGQVVVIGASMVDLTAKIQTPQILREGTNPGSLVSSFGGVGRNVAECMSRLGSPPLFISAVGQDQNGKLMCNDLIECGVPLTGVRQCQQLPTATYCVVLDHKGELYCGVGSMEITDQISVDWMERFSGEIASASLVCFDGNIPGETMKHTLELCWANSIPVWFEPTCVLKSGTPFLFDCHHHIHFTSPNILELRNMHHVLTAKHSSTKHPLAQHLSTKHPSEMSTEEKFSECIELVKPLLAYIPTIIVSLGKDGVLYCSKQGDGKEKCLHYPAADASLLPANVLSVSGAGDSFVGGMLAGIQGGLSNDFAIKAGLNAANLSLQSVTAISSKLTPELVKMEHIVQWAPWESTSISV